MAPSTLTILTGAHVDEVLATLDPEAAVASQYDVFKSFSAAASATSPAPVQTPHRITLSSEKCTSLFMPSRAREAGGMACKIVSMPKGGEGGLPASTVLVDEETGRVRAVVNARKLTAVRNAAGECKRANERSE